VKLAGQIRILEVNDAALRFHGAENQQQMLQGISSTFTPESYHAFALEFALIAEGRRSFDLEATLQTFAGEAKHVILRWAAARGHEKSLERVIVSMVDITERRRAEQALRESENDHRVLIETLRAAVLVYDRDGRILLSNRQAASLLGVPMEQISRMTAMRPAWRYCREDGTELAPGEYPVERVRASGEPVKDLVLGIKAAGANEPTWVLLNASPQRDSRNQVRKIVTTFTDISALKKAEHALRETEDKAQMLGRLLENSAQPFGVAYPSGRVAFFNQAMCDLLGYSSTELQDLNWSTDLTAPEWREIEARAVLRVRDTGQPQRYEKEYLRKDGTRVSVQMVLNMFKAPDGGIQYYYASVTDISERKRVEEALALQARVLETMSEGVGLVSEQGIVTFTNARFDQLFGYNRGELVGKRVEDVTLWSPEETKRIGMEIEAALKAKGVWNGELKNRKKDGTEFVSSARVNSLDLSGRKFYITVQEDITERKASEKKLHEYTEKLQVLSRQLVEATEMERRTIARELHDQVGQALTAVQLNLQLLLRSPEVAGLAGKISDSLTGVTQVLEQVHDLSLDLRPSILDDLGLEAALRWYAYRQAERAGLQLKFRTDGLQRRLDTILETACFRIAQEAITNVVRHAQARTLRVELHATENTLALLVSDDGAGFEVADARQRAVHGASMGLLSMEERALLTGGALEFRSEPGTGTEVRGTFPLRWRPEVEGEQ
jgi:PAS domain S-box-containing protein